MDVMDILWNRNNKMKLLKRYLLFAGYNYYPNGGWHDCKESFLSLDDVFNYLNNNNIDGCDWWHVVDLIDNKIVISDNDNVGVK